MKKMDDRRGFSAGVLIILLASLLSIEFVAVMYILQLSVESKWWTGVADWLLLAITNQPYKFVLCIIINSVAGYAIAITDILVTTKNKSKSMPFIMRPISLGLEEEIKYNKSVAYIYIMIISGPLPKIIINAVAGIVWADYYILLGIEALILFLLRLIMHAIMAKGNFIWSYMKKIPLPKNVIDIIDKK